VDDDVYSDLALMIREAALRRAVLRAGAVS
jgi:hypothetical protein